MSTNQVLTVESISDPAYLIRYNHSSLVLQLKCGPARYRQGLSDPNHGKRQTAWPRADQVHGLQPDNTGTVTRGAIPWTYPVTAPGAAGMAEGHGCRRPKTKEPGLPRLSSLRYFCPGN